MTTTIIALTLRLPVDLHRQLRDQATREHRTLASLIVHALATYVRANPQ